MNLFDNILQLASFAESYSNPFLARTGSAILVVVELSYVHASESRRHRHLPYSAGAKIQLYILFRQRLQYALVQCIDNIHKLCPSLTRKLHRFLCVVFGNYCEQIVVFFLNANVTIQSDVTLFRDVGDCCNN
jgi:hypothetical protein